MRHNQRQVIPLEVVYRVSSGIKFEQKSSTDMRTLHRFTCTACGRLGTWLERPEVVRENARIHATEGCEALTAGAEDLAS